MEALNNFVESNTHIAVSVTFADFHLLVDLFFFPVNLLSFPSVRLSETTETIAAGLGGVRLLQDTRGCGQFLTVCTRLDRQNRSLDD